MQKGADGPPRRGVDAPPKEDRAECKVQSGGQTARSSCCHEFRSAASSTRAERSSSGAGAEETGGVPGVQEGALPVGGARTPMTMTGMATQVSSQVPVIK